MDSLKALFDKIGKKGDEAATGRVEYIIAGLGNPGRDYEQTRHNTGFMALDFLAGELGARVDRAKFKSACGDASIAGHRVLLIKPQTFMNNSGESVRDAAAFYKVPMERVIIIFDDVSLPVGRIRVRPKGSDGGHNGIKSIIYLTGSDVFPRVKIGVGQKPRPDYDLASWVLGKFPAQERETLADAIRRSAEAVKTIITEGTAAAMNKYNG